MALATIWNVPPAGPPPKTMRLPAASAAGRATASASSAAPRVPKRLRSHLHDKARGCGPGIAGPGPRAAAEAWGRIPAIPPGEPATRRTVAVPAGRSIWRCPDVGVAKPGRFGGGSAGDNRPAARSARRHCGLRGRPRARAASACRRGGAARRPRRQCLRFRPGRDRASSWPARISVRRARCVRPCSTRPATRRQVAAAGAAARTAAGAGRAAPQGGRGEHEHSLERARARLPAKQHPRPGGWSGRKATLYRTAGRFRGADTGKSAVRPVRKASHARCHGQLPHRGSRGPADQRAEFDQRLGELAGEGLGRQVGPDRLQPPRRPPGGLGDREHPCEDPGDVAVDGHRPHGRTPGPRWRQRCRPRPPAAIRAPGRCPETGRSRYPRRPGRPGGGSVRAGSTRARPRHRGPPAPRPRPARRRWASGRETTRTAARPWRPGSAAA